MKPLRIGLLYDLETDFPKTAGLAPDASSEFDSLFTFETIVKAVRKLGHKAIKIGNFEALLEKRKKLKNLADIFINMTEGVNGRNREARAAIVLEYMDLPFIGSDALTLSAALDKHVTKQILKSENIPVPFSFSATGESRLPGNLPYPLIVKPRWEGSSMGINMDSIVRDDESLTKRIAYINRLYRQPALVEQFITGSEFTVPVFGYERPYSMTPLRITLNGKDMGGSVYDNRYIRDSGIKYEPLSGGSGNGLSAKLKELAAKTYLLLSCRDFGRVDFRIDEKGKIYVLEVNPLPALHPEDALAVSAESEGKSYESLMQLIIDEGLKRNGLSVQT